MLSAFQANIAAPGNGSCSEALVYMAADLTALLKERGNLVSVQLLKLGGSNKRLAEGYEPCDDFPVFLLLMPDFGSYAEQPVSGELVITKDA